MRLREVVADRQTSLEEQPRTTRVGDRRPADLHPHMTRAGEDVHARVRAARVGEDLLVLLEPGVHRVPVEPDHLAQLLDRGVPIAPRSLRRLPLPRANGEGGAVAAAWRVGHSAVRLEQLGAHVVEREIVGRVVGDLPHQHRTSADDDQLAAQVRAHALGPGFEADAAAGAGRLGLRRGHRRIVAQLGRGEGSAPAARLTRHAADAIHQDRHPQGHDVAGVPQVDQAPEEPLAYSAIRELRALALRRSAARVRQHVGKLAS